MSNNGIPNCPALNSNPDIVGIGVRLSFYAQTILLVLLVNRSWKDAPGALWTLTATSFGLTVAAIIQAAIPDPEKSLSLFEAIAVSNLVWQSNFASYLALASYSRHKLEDDEERRAHKRKTSKIRHQAKLLQPDNQAKIGATLQICFSCILTIILWFEAPTFGPSENICNEAVTFMIFVIPTKAVGAGRIVALIFSFSLFIIYFSITANEIKHYLISAPPTPLQPVTSLLAPPTPTPDIALVPTRTISHNRSSSDIRDDLSRVADDNGFISPYTPTHHRQTSRSSNPPYYQRPSRIAKPKSHWSCGNTDASLVTLIVIQAITTTYFVVSTELLLARNPSFNQGNNNNQIGDEGENNNEWAFGQILALIVVVPSALAVMNAFITHGARRLEHKGVRTHARRPSVNSQTGIPRMNINGV